MEVFNKLILTFIIIFTTIFSYGQEYWKDYKHLYLQAYIKVPVLEEERDSLATKCNGDLLFKRFTQNKLSTLPSGIRVFQRGTRDIVMPYKDYLYLVNTFYNDRSMKCRAVDEESYVSALKKDGKLYIEQDNVIHEKVIILQPVNYKKGKIIFKTWFE